jgi:Domain of unknown function (DUF1707)
MTGPADHRADRGRFRASHDDRDRVVELLKSAFVEGRLVKDEFDERVGQAMASRTYAELAMLTDDIPPPPTPPRPVVRPRPRPRRPVKKIAVATVLGTVAPVMLVLAVLLGNEDLAKAFGMPAMFTVMAWVAALAQTLDTRHSRRLGQVPPRHEPRGRPAGAGRYGPGDELLILCAGRPQPATMESG